MLVPVLPLLHQYTSLLQVLVLNLAMAHRTLCKLLSILLALFSDIVSKVYFIADSIILIILLPTPILYTGSVCSS